MSTLAAIISSAGSGYERWDRTFARALAQTLADQRERLCLEPIETLGLLDVAVTFHLKQRLRVVVTGTLPDIPGELTIAWSESDLALVGAHFRGREAGRDPYLVCSLDFFDAGRGGVMTRAASGLSVGDRVTVRARVTVGAEESWRVGQGSVPIDSVSLDPKE